MADTEQTDDTREETGSTSGPQGAPAKPKKKDRKQAIIVVASVVGVIIAWLTYRSRSSSSSSNAQAAGSGGGVSTTPYMAAATQQAQAGAGMVAGYGDPSASAGFNSYMQNIQAEIDALSQQIGPAGSSTSPVTPAPAAPTLGTYWGPSTVQSNPGVSYIDNANYYGTGKGQVFQVQPSGQGFGTPVALTNPEFLQLGKPTYAVWQGGKGAVPK